jgi:hypothetical protein
MHAHTRPTLERRVHGYVAADGAHGRVEAQRLTEARLRVHLAV